MKIGIISDIHSNAPALERVLEELQVLNVDQILCAGDLVGYYSFPNRVISLLRIARVDAVLGNHDWGILNGTPTNFNPYAKRALDWNRRELTEDHKAYLAALPKTQRKKLNGKELFISHGSPRNPIRDYIYESDIDRNFINYSFDSDVPEVIILGQTHQPFVKRTNESLIINPGSVGQPRDEDPRASFGVLDMDTLETEIVRVEYNIDETIEKTVKYLPKRLADRLIEGK